MNNKTIFLILLCCWTLTGNVIAAPADPLPAITVMGTGEVSGKPDMARVDIGVVSQQETASAAMRQNTEAVEKVMATLKQYNIAESDIQTSNFSIGPQYDYNRPQQPPRLIGYRVSNQVRVAVRRIDDLGALLDEVIAAGSNQVNNVTFDIDEAMSLEDTARRRAMSDAQRKAALYAQEANVKLGAVIRVEEMSGPVAFQRMNVSAMAMDEASVVPMAPGQQLIRQTVRVTYAIATDP